MWYSNSNNNQSTNSLNLYHCDYEKKDKYDKLIYLIFKKARSTTAEELKNNTTQQLLFGNINDKRDVVSKRGFAKWRLLTALKLRSAK